jgi:predicted glycoside hydrolase/deacetylase ChbG (UPF0249 family)
MKKLVVVADDFGSLPSINLGIEYTCLNGLVNEISLVTRGKYTDQAIKIINQHRIANVGIHLELLGVSDLGRQTTSEVEKMAASELAAFETLVGRPPTHITSHKGIHGNFKLLNFLIAYARKYQIPIRKPFTAFSVELAENNYAAEISLKRAKLKSTDYLFARMFGNDTEEVKKAYIDSLAKVKDNESAEIIIHPAFFDKDLLFASSLNYQRTRDLKLFTDLDFLDQIKRLGYTPCTYRQI